MRIGLRAANGENVRAEDIEFLSPYPTHNIRRFGHYKLHLDRRPEAWIRDPFESTKRFANPNSRYPRLPRGSLRAPRVLRQWGEEHRLSASIGYWPAA